MGNNDDQKDFIKNNQNNVQKNSSDGDDLYNDVLNDLARRSADNLVNSNNSLSKVGKENKDFKKISSLEEEINNILRDKNNNNTIEPDDSNLATKKIKSSKINSQEKKEDLGSKSEESLKGSVSTAAAMFAIEKAKNKTKNEDSSFNEKKEEIIKTETDLDRQKTVSSIKDSINEFIGNTGDEGEAHIKKEEDGENIIDDKTRELLKKQDKKKGIDQTYYSDLSKAMSSDKPATMFELLEKAKFEKKEAKIRSPRSKKNIIYIVGSIVLILAIIIISFFLFSNKNEVSYIKEKRVNSLVYSDLDTGINVSNVDSGKIKQAIRKVVETKIDSGKLHQIYYAVKDQFGNLRRIGVKQIFAKTDINPPELLYKNIENEFMHGVYKTDKNHAFIILKTISYDRAFEGMKEWENTMIDDLAPYLDLPNEAGDRSLIEDGFSDDIIKNKNVRVARFLPRGVDRRNGLLDSIVPTQDNLDKKEQIEKNINSNFQDSDTLINDNNNKIDNENNLSLFFNLFNFKKGFIQEVFAQGTNKACYLTKSICFDFYGKEIECKKKYFDCKYNNQCDDESKQVMIQQTILNQENDPVYPYTDERNDSYEYSCIDSIQGSDAVGDTLDESKPIVCYKMEIFCVDNQGYSVPENDPRAVYPCNTIIYNDITDPVYGSDKYGVDGYACINTVDDDGSGVVDESLPMDDMNDTLVNTRGDWDWLLDIFFRDDLLSGGGQIEPGQSLEAVEIIQNELVLLGLMDDISISGTFDLLTQETIKQFQLVNGLPQSGIIDENTLVLLKGIISGQGEIFGGSQAAIINDYLPVGGTIGLGTYSEDIQVIQILLFVGGYEISHFNGVFDEELCSAIQSYQEDNNLPISDGGDCVIDESTIIYLNKIISDNNYLGSGFIINGNGYLVGSGELIGTNGPGAIGFEINTAEADSLKEGDIILMYTFLDENTILIARSEEVITEVIKRRAFNDIFNK